jgi:hypothetical protein
MSNRDISYVKLLTEDSSFQLVRTNPKLTGNIKVTMDDAGGMWLESIKVNPELSKDIYSRVPIDIKQSHTANVFRFLNNGTTPNEITFDIKEQVDSTKTSKDLKDQYDFSHYFSGVKYLASNKYSERMSYFAPLYLKKDVPDYFIIFKIDDPANFSLDQLKQKYEVGDDRSDYIIDLFKRASLIKTFDLRAESIPGKYLRDYINSPGFPTSPLTVSYGEDDFTTFNGILINEGKFGSRGELLSDLYQSSQPLKFFEENITNGFSRNGIIVANILNLEFIFNDDSSQKYDFNRYLGLYVNAIELTKVDIDLDRAYFNRGTWENVPHFRKKFLETDEVVLSQTNEAGVIVPFKNSTIHFSEFDSTFETSDNLYLNYVSDKDNNLYIPNLTRNLEIEYGDSFEADLTSTGTLVTVTLPNHGYSTSDKIVVISAIPEFAGEFTITVINPNTFTYTVPIAPSVSVTTGQCKKKLNDVQVSPFVIEYDDPKNLVLTPLYFKRAESASISSAGTGYSTTNNVTTTAIIGTGTGLTVKVISPITGPVTSLDPLTLIAGTSYSTSTNVATTSTGSGVGLTVDIIDDGLGGVASVVINAPGNGYQVGDVITITGGGNDSTITVDGALTDLISSIVILNKGTGYLVGDQVQVNSGNSDAILTIDSISTSKTINANVTSHGYSTDDLLLIASNDFEFAGEFLISVINADNFTYTTKTLPTVSSSTGVARRERKTTQFRFANRKIDLGLFFGQSRDNFLQDVGFASKVGGHSFGVIRIEKNLNNYDEIRIYHPNGTQSDTIGRFDLIISTQLYPLIPNPGEYYVYNDYDNILGFDEFYMNGGGSLSQVASALAGCINGIRNRAFTAYAYDERVFIKLNAIGDFDSTHKISFTSPTLDYSVITINDDYTGSSLSGAQFSFMGGSKEVGNRLIIDSGHLEKIKQNLDSILVKTSDSWSKIRKVSKYIDEINESNTVTQALRTSTVADYDGKIALVLVENEIPTISNLEFLMRPMFRPSFGLLSFYLIKDLDFDFYSSTYTNFPTIDLYQHYFIPPNVTLLEPGIEYIVYDGDIIVNDGTPSGVFYAAGSTFTVASIASYSISSRSPIVAYCPEANATLLPDIRTIPINDKNKELNNFAGFSILKDPSKVIPQNSSQTYNLKDKYLNGLTSTEYDFYKENESLDFALRSKMIPYITKWGIKNGKDTRDNPYRLNTEIAFGRNNFSSDHEDRTQNPINFTHEWFYIESKFNYVLDDSILAQNTNYFDTPLDESALLSDPDYFINYFTYTPTTTSSVEVADTQFRYSSLFKNSAGQYEAFFKGFRVTFKDVTDPNVLGADGKPVAKENSTRFEGYRFSCILKPVEEDINDHTKPPVRYRVIEHRDYKFILIVIEVRLGSINQIDNFWKDDSLFGGIQVDNTNFDFVIPFSTEYFNSINGDYRVEYDADSVSNLTHTLLYALKNKKYNTLLNSFSNIKMGSKLNLTATGVNTTDNTIKIFKNPLTPNYSGTLKDDIINPNNSTLIFIKDLNTGLDIFLCALSSFIPVSPITNPIDSSLDSFLHYDGLSYQAGLLTLPSTLYGILPAGVISIIGQKFIFKVLTGGEGYLEKLFEKISFARFKKAINEQDPIIEFLSYSLNSIGASVLADDPNFYLEIPDVSRVEKINQLISVPTAQVPIQFSGQEGIGVDYEVADLPVRYELNRYRGEYEPIVQNYSIYQSNYRFTKNPINDLSLSNTKINSAVATLMEIQNFNHIKVADTQILELESDESYLPVYPKINEVAIGQAKYFLLRGNWDWGFHYKYSSKNEYLPVSGAKRIEEDDSFLAKLINLPEYIELENFKVETIDPAVEFNTVDVSKIEIVLKDGVSTVEGIINVNNVLTRFLIEDGIASKFNEYLINSDEFIGNFNRISDPDITVSSYVREYIKLNILKLYDIDVNEFYIKPNAAVNSTNTTAGANPNSVEFVFLNDQQRFAQGYKILKALQINKKDKLILKFSFAKSKSTGLSISPKIKIKFI